MNGPAPVAVSALLALLLAGAALAAEWYVSPSGSDDSPGTAERPFATLGRAQLAARSAAGRQPATVFLRSGTYYLRETLVFTPADSGALDAPVVYRAYPGESPVVSGGERLTLRWEPFRDGILRADVPEDLATDQLFVDGERRPMARYPDYDAGQRILNGFAADAISPERARRWADPAGGYIHAMHSAEWGDYHYAIMGKDADGALQYEGGWQNNRQMGMHPEQRFVENIAEELDAPSEWFLDRKAHTLYFLPPAGLDMAQAVVEGVRLRHLLELRGDEASPVRFVSFVGLTFRHAARTFMDTKEPLLRSDWTIYRGGALFVTGAEDCRIEECSIEQVGGNAIFVSGYNRRVAIRGCHIPEAGANGVAFVGDPSAVRSPLYEYNERQTLQEIDTERGPRSDEYPADCLVDDCLIYRSGRVEKQTAPVQISMAARITVRHCSLYDVPRAGINIGDGCWGGHVIESCDVFDTVKETGDHGSFNSWGRDRYWGLKGLDLDDDATWAAHSDLPLLDTVEPITIRNSRWRCDHGWDIDLDDGSSSYTIVNNLCLHGGIKNREGFRRVVENNVIVGNGYHPHCWFRHSEDVFRRNIVGWDAYYPAGGMPPTPWGAEMDDNLVHAPGVAAPRAAVGLAAQSGRDTHSLVADAQFVDPAAGDFRVRDDSPALALGFTNFPMDQFGVRSPRLRALARTPEIPRVVAATAPGVGVTDGWPSYVWQATARDIAGPGDRSAYGLPDESGVLLLDVPADTLAATAGLRAGDVIVACDGQPVRCLDDLLARQAAAAGADLAVSAIRAQARVAATLSGYAFAVTDSAATSQLTQLPLLDPDETLQATVSAGEPGTRNEPLHVLTDGLLAMDYGPVFANGVRRGAYKLDLGRPESIVRVSTYSSNQNGNRGQQRFTLFGSAWGQDPGWDVSDRTLFTPIATVDTGEDLRAFTATGIGRGDGLPLGTFRWLVWAASPVTEVAGGENTAFQEFQVVPARP